MRLGIGYFGFSFLFLFFYILNFNVWILQFLKKLECGDKAAEIRKEGANSKIVVVSSSFFFFFFFAAGDSDRDDPVSLFFLWLAPYFFNGLLEATRSIHLSSRFWRSYGGCFWLGRHRMDQDWGFPYFLGLFLFFSFVLFSFLDWILLVGCLFVCSRFRGRFLLGIWNACLRRSRLLLRCVVVESVWIVAFWHICCVAVRFKLGEAWENNWAVKALFHSFLSFSWIARKLEIGNSASVQTECLRQKGVSEFLAGLGCQERYITCWIVVMNY